MNRDLIWLVGTAVAVSAATLGTVGLLAHVDEARSMSVIAFDVLWILSALMAGTSAWRRTKWGHRS